MRILFNLFSLITLAARRLWNQRLLTACLLLGLVAAAGLLSSIPLYSDAAQNRLLQGQLTDAGTYRPPFSFLWRYAGAWHGAITWENYLPANEYLTAQATSIVDLPLDEQVRYVSSAKLRLFPAKDAAFVPDEPLIWATVGFITGLADRIQIVEGSFPSGGEVGEPVQVLIGQDTADLLGLQLGEIYVLMATGTSGAQIPVEIAGVWRAVNGNDPYWFYTPEAFDLALLTSEEAFSTQVTVALDKPVDTAVWYQIFDGVTIRPATVNDLLGRIATVEARLTVLLNYTALEASPVSALQQYGDQAKLLTLVLTVFSLPVLGLAVYFISLISGMVVQNSQSEIANMRGRGISRRQIVNLYVLEGLLVSILGLAGGLQVGRWMAQLMTRARTFLDTAVLTGGAHESVAIVTTSTAYAYAAVGVLLTMAALIIPALSASRHSIVTLRWEQARSMRAPAWQRYYLDLAMLIAPLYGWYQLSKQGTLTVGAGNDPFSNPLLFLVPVLFCFALGLVAVRLFPAVVLAMAWLAAHLPGTTLLLTLRQLARSTSQYLGPLLLLSLTVSLATFTASMAVTLDNHLSDQVYYQVGADLNLAELGESTEEEETITLTGESSTTADAAQWLFLPVSDHLEVSGVQAAARVGGYSATAKIGTRRYAGRILGIDRVDFPKVAYYRPDFASNESLGGLMNRLALASDAVLVSTDFMVQQGLTVGDPLQLTVGTSGRYADASFTIVGSLRLFPTLYPQDGPFFVANLDHLHDALGGTYPYNVWLSTEPATDSVDAATAATSIVQGVRDLGVVVVSDLDARTIIADSQTQPERQGLFGLLSVGFLAAAGLTVVGFLVFAVVSFRRRLIELGMLRAIGLSVGQMAIYLTAESAILIFTGVLTGSGLGVLASTLFIPFFQVGEGKTALIPPFVVQIAWEQLAFICLVFGVMFLVAVIVLGFLLVRMKVFEAVKLGETI
jgi:putative ABC transport system permease protein